MSSQTFFMEMTDTFGGELNYCWINRFIVNAKSIRGAIQKVARETGFNFRFNGAHYKAKNACIAVYECFEYETPPKDWLERAKRI